MSQPELEFEFDPREFLHEEVKRTPPVSKRAVLRPVAFAGLVVAMIIGVHSLYGDAKNYIASTETEDRADREAALANTKALLARVEAKADGLAERVVALEANLYRSKAIALGFKNPAIRPVSLATEISEPWVFNYQFKKENRIELKVVQITKEAIFFEVTQHLASDEVTSVQVTQPLKVGSSVELTQGANGEGVPHIFMTILEIPTQNIAIIAVGSKALAES